MATTNFLVTMKFNAGEQGFTESWYKPGTDLTYETVMADLDVVAAARNGMLASGVFIKDLRVSRMDKFGDSKPRRKGPDFKDPQTSLLARGIVEKAWLVRATAGQQGGEYRRQLWLRGMPDVWSDWTVGASLPNIPASLNGANSKLKAYEAALVAKGFALRALDKAKPFIPIKSVEVDGGQILLTTDGPHGLTAIYNDVDMVPQRTRLKIRGITSDGSTEQKNEATAINGVGRLVIDVPATDKLKIGLSPGNPAITFLYKGGGVLQTQVYIYSTLFNLELIDLGKRDTGLGYSRRRGRSRKKVCK